MSHTVKDKEKLLARVRRIRGQAEGLERLLDQDGECGKVLQQIAAIRGATNGLMGRVLEDHIREHLGAEVSDPEVRRDELESVVNVVRSYLK